MRRRGTRHRRRRWWPLWWQLRINRDRTRKRLKPMRIAFLLGYLRQRALNEGTTVERLRARLLKKGASSGE